MSSVIELNQYKVLKTPNNEHYFLEVIPTKVNEEIIEFVYIFKKEQDGFSKISPYSDYFLYSRVLGKSIANKSTNTKINGHGKFIISFLNYIFYESEKRISKIQDLDRKLIIEFLSQYAKGQTGNQKGNWLNKDTIEKSGVAIMCFVYWLKYGYPDDSISGLKKIKKSDFDIGTKQVKRKKVISNGEEKDTAEVEQFIKCPPDFIRSGSGKGHGTGSKNKREKAVNINLYTVKLLIEKARKKDPQLVFAIALGAFVGLRQGDVIQMNKFRLSLPRDMDLTLGYKIDLVDELQISNNIKDCGKIKTHRIQPIYEPFLPILIDAYNKHLDILEKRGLDNHKYGALFFNNEDDGVMRQKSLNRRFKVLVDEVIEELRYESLVKNNANAMTQYEILSDVKYKLTFHSLRHFYTHALERLESNAFTIMYYRGDSVVESQNTYRSNRNTIEGIKAVMDSMKEELIKYGFDGLL